MNRQSRRHPTPIRVAVREEPAPSPQANVSPVQAAIVQLAQRVNWQAVPFERGNGETFRVGGTQQEWIAAVTAAPDRDLLGILAMLAGGIFATLPVPPVTNAAAALWLPGR